MEDRGIVIKPVVNGFLLYVREPLPEKPLDEDNPAEMMLGSFKAFFGAISGGSDRQYALVAKNADEALMFLGSILAAWQSGMPWTNSQTGK